MGRFEADAFQENHYGQSSSQEAIGIDQQMQYPQQQPQAAVLWPPQEQPANNGYNQPAPTPQPTSFPQQNGVYSTGPQGPNAAGNGPAVHVFAPGPPTSAWMFSVENNSNGLPPLSIAIPNVRPNSEAWKTDLFNCMEDPANAAITFFFPCLTFGQIAEIIDNGQTSCGTSGMLYMLVTIFLGVSCIYSCTYRTKLRSKSGLVESPALDWLVHFFCEPCALCQEYRELQLRGWDPSIGWLGNVAVKRNQNQHPLQQVGMMPPTDQRMMA